MLRVPTQNDDQAVDSPSGFRIRTLQTLGYISVQLFIITAIDGKIKVFSQVPESRAVFL